MAEGTETEKPKALWRCIPTEKAYNLFMCTCNRKAIPQRTVMVLLTIFGISLAYMQRVCLNLAIVEMTIAKVRNDSDMVLAGRDQRCEGVKGTRPVIENIQGGKFDWDEETQSYILGSFFYGYFIWHIPSSLLCDRFGTKYIFLSGMALSTLATVLIPMAAIYFGWVAVCILRAISGFGQAPVFPGAMEMIARWIPPHEQARVSGILNSSLSLGTILGNIPTAYIMRFTESWTLVFYFYGILSVIWCILYFFFVHSSPARHPFITPEEKEYLDAHIKPHKHRKRPPKGIWTDLTFYSIIIVQFGHDYCLFTIITNIPKYFNNVLMFTSDMTAYLVCLPQILSLITSLIWGAMADYLIYEKHVKKVKLRIIYVILASWVPTAFIVIMCYMRCIKFAAVAMVCLAMAFKSAFYSSVKVSCIDISQTQAGLVSGISNGVGAAAGFIAPLTIGKICKDNTFPQWDLVSYITLVIGVLVTIPYIMFVKANRAAWDYTDEEETPEVDKGFKAKLSCHKMI